MDDKHVEQIVQALDKINAELKAIHDLVNGISTMYSPLLRQVASIEAKIQGAPPLFQGQR